MKKMFEKYTYSPRIIPWLFVPSLIGEEIIYDLLCYDIFIKDYQCTAEIFISKMNTLDSVFLAVIDIDKLFTQNVDKSVNFSDLLKNLKNQLLINKKIRYIVYSFNYNEISQVFSGADNVFTRDSAALLDTNRFTKDFLETIRSFQGEGNSFRSHIRIVLYPQAMHLAAIRRQTEPDIVIEGYIKDLSVNGIGILLYNKSLGPVFSVEEEVSVTITFRRDIVEIKRAFIKRIDLNEQLLGIHFDFSDRSSISNKNASMLNDIILGLLKNSSYKFQSLSGKKWNLT